MAALPSRSILVALFLFALPGFFYRSVWPVSCFIVGFCWTVLRADFLLDQFLPADLERADLTLNGTVVSLVRQQGTTLKFTVSAKSLTHTHRTIPDPGKILLRWYEADDKVRIGQAWRFKVRLKRPRGFQNPGGFDFEKWLFRRGIRANGYIVDGQRLPTLEGGSWWGRYRELVQRHLIGSGFENQGLMRALAIGDRGGVGRDRWIVLTRTGTLHLLAISGLHIGMVAGFGFIVGSMLARVLGPGLLWFPAVMPGAVFAILGGGTYALLAGLTIPTQRAVIMIVAVMMATLVNRSINIVRSLAAALILVLLIDPLSVLDPGFWLSFGALAAILLALKATAGTGSRIPRVVRVQLLLTLLLAPMVLLFFGQVSVSAPLANLIAIPVVAFTVVPLVLSASASLGAGWLEFADLLFGLADTVLGWLWPLLSLLSQPRWAVWAGAPPWWALLSAGLGLVVLLVSKIRYRGLLGVTLLVPIMLPAAALNGSNIEYGGFTLTGLDVGQGLSTLVRTRNHTLLYDTGARFSPGFDAGTAVVVPYLRQSNIEKLDTLVVSHGDGDHIGGMRAVLGGVEVGRRLTSVPGKVPNSESCVAGQNWEWDGVVFRVLSPGTSNPAPHNNSSCVLRIAGYGGSALLTGDIEIEAESALSARFGDLLRSDILLVPHKGSKSSSSARFIDLVAPAIAIVSAGYLNKYGHPAKAVVQRYQDRNIPIFNTALSGAVTVRVSADEISVETYRNSHQRYWFADSGDRLATR